MPSLPHRQLRKTGENLQAVIDASLPHRQLRKGLLTIRVGTCKLILVSIDGLKTKAFIVI